ncbi:MAG: TGS domain-containing protein, partial [Christensenellaceae bacterium]
MKITLFDGTVKEFEQGSTAKEIAKSLNQKLGKTALAAKIDGKVVEVDTPITQDCTLEILTFEDEQGKKALWHTGSHVLAQAVKRLFPD